MKKRERILSLSLSLSLFLSLMFLPNQCTRIPSLRRINATKECMTLFFFSMTKKRIYGIRNCESMDGKSTFCFCILILITVTSVVGVSAVHYIFFLLDTVFRAAWIEMISTSSLFLPIDNFLQICYNKTMLHMRKVLVKVIVKKKGL